MRSLDIDPLARKIMGLKRGYLTAPLQVISSGETNRDATQLEYLGCSTRCIL